MYDICYLITTPLETKASRKIR